MARILYIAISIVALWLVALSTVVLSNQNSISNSSSHRLGVSVPALQAVQHGQTVSATSADDGTVHTGIVTNQAVVLSLANATASRYVWTISGPSGSQSKLTTNATGALATVWPDLPGTWTVVLLGYPGDAGAPTRYVLALDVKQVRETVNTGPLRVPTLSANEVESPVEGKTMFYDRDNGSRLSWKNPDGTVAFATGSDVSLGGDIVGSYADAGIRSVGGVPFALASADASIGQVLVRTDAGTWGPSDTVANAITAVSADTATSSAAINGRLPGTLEPVRAVCTANITLSGLQTCDGVALAVGDSVLVAGQTAAATNGVYVASGSAWTRRTDFDSTAKAKPGTRVHVSEGAAYANSDWYMQTAAPIVLGTTALNWQSERAASDVRKFGARCDGSTNDTAAFQAAFDLGGDVTAPAGTCVVDTVYLPAYPKRVNFTGTGEDSTILRAAETNEPVIATTIGSTSHASTLSRFSVQAHDSGSTGAAIQIGGNAINSGANGLVLDRIGYITSPGGTGAFAQMFDLNNYLGNVYQNHITHPRISNQSRGPGVAVRMWDGGKNDQAYTVNVGSIEDSYIVNVGYMSLAFDLLGSNGILVKNCLVELNYTGAIGSTSLGAAVKAGRFTTIENPWFETNAFAAIDTSVFSVNNVVGLGGYWGTSTVVLPSGVSGWRLTNTTGLTVTDNGTSNLVEIGSATSGTISGPRVLTAAGASTPGGASLTVPAGSLLTTPEDGALEYDGSRVYFTIGRSRQLLAPRDDTAPTATSFLPAIGRTTSGLAFELLGAHLGNATAVAIGGTACTGVSVLSDTRLWCTSPAKGAGTYDVVVTTPNGTATITGGYTSATEQVANPNDLTLWPSNNLTVTTDTITETTDSSPAIHNVGQVCGSVAIGNAVAISFEAKANGGSWFDVTFGQGSAYFNLTTGAAGTVSGTGVTASIVPVGSGYFRGQMSIASLTTNDTLSMFLASADGVSTYQGNGTRSIKLRNISVTQK